jgi:hypothetical protein
MAAHTELESVLDWHRPPEDSKIPKGKNSALIFNARALHYIPAGLFKGLKEKTVCDRRRVMLVSFGVRKMATKMAD